MNKGQIPEGKQEEGQWGQQMVRVLNAVAGHLVFTERGGKPLGVLYKGLILPDLTFNRTPI